jgi:hypothetical protein
LTAKEAIHRQMDELRDRLTATTHSELEKLLIDRICISWVAVYHADIALAEHLLAHPSASPATRAAQQRLDGAHRRFVTAVKALATVQKLLQRAPSPLELLTRTVPEKTTSRPSGRSRTSPVAEGVPIFN